MLIEAILVNEPYWDVRVLDTDHNIVQRYYGIERFYIERIVDAVGAFNQKIEEWKKGDRRLPPPQAWFDMLHKELPPS